MQYPQSLPKQIPGNKCDASFFFADEEYVSFVIHKDYEINMHYHTYYEICIVTGGTGRHYLENFSMDVEKGCVFAIPPNVNHGFYNYGGLEVFHAIIEDKFLVKYGAELNYLAGFSRLFNMEKEPDKIMCLFLPEEQMQSIEPHLAELMSYNDVVYPSRIQLKNAAFFHLLMRLCHSAYIQSSGIEREMTDAIRQSVEFLNRSYSSKVTTKMLADIAYMSESAYVRHFMKMMYMGPMEYLTRLRLEKAKELLLNSNAGMSSIAFDCGFYDASHFAKTFKKYEHITPQEYRKGMRNNGER